MNVRFFGNAAVLTFPPTLTYALYDRLHTQDSLLHHCEDI